MSYQEATSMAHLSAVGPPYFPTLVASPGNPGPVADPASTTEARVREAPPKGYYWTKKGQLKKSNPPTKERREYGLRQVLITKEELEMARSRTVDQPLDIFAKNPGLKARVRCTMAEIKKINDHRSQNNERLIHLSERVSNNAEFKAKAVEAENRHNKYEELRQKGQSTRTKEARDQLHLAQTGGH